MPSFESIITTLMELCPNQTELLGFLHIGIAVFGYINWKATQFYLIPMFDFEMYEHYCVSYAFVFYGSFYAAGTWFWTPNLANTRMIMRIHSILVYVTLIILIYITRIRFMTKTFPNYGIFDYGLIEEQGHFYVTSKKTMFILVMLVTIHIVIQGYYIINRIRILGRKKTNVTAGS